MKNPPMEIQKVKLIGDGKFKPFWAPIEEINAAYRMCRDFMNKYIYAEYHTDYSLVLDLISQKVGPKAFQHECGYKGSVTRRVYNPAKKKSWQVGKIRVYNVYLDKYREEGYYIVPRVKLESCKIKDKSGIHCKDRNEIARIFIEKIIAPYFANTFIYTEKTNNFTITIGIDSESESSVVVDLRHFIMILFEADLLYKENNIKMASSFSEAYIKAYDNIVKPMIVKPMSDIFSVMFQNYPIMFQNYSPEFIFNMWKESIDEQIMIGSYRLSVITSDDCTYDMRFDADEADSEIYFGADNELHLFDIISKFTQHVVNEEKHPIAFHFSFKIKEKFWPINLVEELKRRESV